MAVTTAFPQKKKGFQESAFMHIFCEPWMAFGWAVFHKWAESIQIHCRKSYQQTPVLSAGKSMPVQLQLA